MTRVRMNNYFIGQRSPARADDIAAHHAERLQFASFAASLRDGGLIVFLSRGNGATSTQRVHCLR